MTIEIVKRHIEDRASYRIIAKRLRETTSSLISTYTVYKRVKESCLTTKQLVDVVKEMKPKFNGYLHVDGKGIKVKGYSKRDTTLFIGQDGKGLPIHQELMSGENKEEIIEFLRVIKTEIKYPFKGVISDMNDNIIQAVRQEMPEIPHQFCITHILRWIDRMMKYQGIRRQICKLLKKIKDLNNLYGKNKNKSFGLLKEAKKKLKVLKKKHKPLLVLRRCLRKYVLSDTLHKIRKRRKIITQIRRKFLRQRKIIRFMDNLLKYEKNIFCYLKNTGMPRNNNLLENYIKQYERRLKTIEGFGEDMKVVKGYLDLMGVCYCFKKYTDCRKRNKFKNGKTPLEVAGVDISGLDWVRFTLN